MTAHPDFLTDLIVALFSVWLAMAPLIAASALLEFFAWRRQRQTDRIWGKRR